MTTSVSGLIKIGKTKTDNYQERMRFLETNGYYNVSGLKRYFAIELIDYDDKESLLHEIFNKHQVGTSELFALDQTLARQLLLSLDGKVIFPITDDKEKEFDNLSKVRKQEALFSFYKKGLKNGDEINFLADKSITAKVSGERTVSYKNEMWKLSPLTSELYSCLGKVNKSGAYRGASHWEFDGKKLVDLPNIENK